MMVTAGRARTMWCPFSSETGRRGTEQPNGTQCLASDCMAWVWQTASVGSCGMVRHRRLISDGRTVEEAAPA